MGGLTRLIIVLSMFVALTLTSNAQYVFPITQNQLTTQFYTSLYIGAAAKTPLNLLLDLGSNLSWLNCRKLDSLSSLRLVKCQTPTCKSILGSCDSRDICLYQQPNSSLMGHVVQDTSTSLNTRFTFSCIAPTKILLPPKIVGVLGLSTGEYSVWSQMTKKHNIKPEFSICLPSPGSTGNFYIGGIAYSIPSTLTPMRVRSGNYFMTLNSVYVEGTSLSLNPSLLEGGAKFSTVVSYTVLQSDIYNALAQSFTLKAKAMGITQVSPVTPFKNCFDARTAAGKNIPVIELGVPGRIGEVKWTFHKTNTVVNVNKNVICLAFIDGGKKLKENIVVGTHQLTNYYLSFDMSRTELRFSESLLLHNVSCST